jgi:biotin transport system substrate-specific component
MRSSVFPLSLVKNSALQVLIGALVIALAGQVRVPLFFTPIHMTLHTLAVMLMAATLGPKKAPLAVCAQLALIGLSPAKAAAIGYYIGMILQAFLVGTCVQEGSYKNRLSLFFSLTAISCIQMSIGALWLSAFVGFKNALSLGFIPFLPGDVIKCVVATCALYKAKK